MVVLLLVPMVTALLLSTVPSLSIGCCSHELTKKSITTFLFLNAWKLLKIMLKYPYLHLTLSNTPKCYFFSRKALFHKINKILKMAAVKTCAFKSCEKCSFTSQNISSDVLQATEIIVVTFQ